ncbi:hypothetical protein HY772_02865 [Candidatus Woesearchaeota archaeon]|nr:hypothetical protein [Candidatus Woesearchaeota archaeon]
MNQADRLFVVLLVCLFLFVLPATSVASLTQVFSGNVFSGENVKVDDRFTFRVTLNDDRDSLFVDGGNMYASVPLNQCKELREGLFEFCFNATDFNTDEHRYFATIRVFQRKPAITLSRTATNTRFFVGEEQTITSTITVSTDDARNITFIDQFPDSIEIVDIDGGCRKYENSVYARYNNIDAGASKTCTYTIKGKREFHGELQAKAVYYDGYELKEIYSGGREFDILPLLEVQTAQVVEDFTTGTYTPKNESVAVKLFFDDYDFSDSAQNPGVLIGENVRFAINVSNHLNKSLTIRGVNIHIPPSLQYLGTITLRRELINASGNRTSTKITSDQITQIDQSLLRWSGKLNHNVSKQFFLKFGTRRSGFQELVVTADYVYENKNYTEIKHEPFSVADPGLKLKMDLIDKSDMHAVPAFTFTEDDDTRDVEALSAQRVRINAYNINPYSILRDVRVSLNTTLFDVLSSTIPYLGLQESKTSHDFGVVFPRLNVSTTYKINISASYKNQFGEEYQNSTEFEITVKPFADLSITHDSSEGFVLDGGEETDFTVAIDNPRITNVRNVEVQDVVDSGLSVIGATSKKVKLNKDADTDVYTYRITPPRVHEKTYYNVTTFVTYFDPQGLFIYRTNKTSTFTVNPKRPEVTVTKYLSDDEVSVGEIIEVDYEIKNTEAEEEVRDMIVYFSLQNGIDTIGDSKYYIKRLGPLEAATLNDIERIRPKIANDSLKLNKTLVEYSDAYGNAFTANSTEESIKVAAAEIIGPGIFVEKRVPSQLNVSQETTVTIEVRNIGTEEALVQVEDNDRAWTVNVPGKSLRVLEYPITFNVEGSYSLSAPIAHYKNQGLSFTAKGDPVTVTVSQYVPVLVPTPSTAQVEQTGAAATLAENVTTLEEFVSEKQQIGGLQLKRQYILIAVFILIIVAIIVAYSFYKKGRTKKPTFFLD